MIMNILGQINNSLNLFFYGGISALSFAGIGGIILYLIKDGIAKKVEQGIKYDYDKKLKDFEHGYDKKLKEFEHNLDILKNKESLKFDVTHREMVNRFSKMLNAVADSLKTLDSLSADIMLKKSKDEIKESFFVVGQNMIDLKTSLIASCIFFPQEIEDGFNEILLLFDELLLQLAHLNEEVEKEDIIKRILEIEPVKKQYEEKYYDLIHILRDRIKRILGVTNNIDITDINETINVTTE